MNPSSRAAVASLALSLLAGLVQTGCDGWPPAGTDGGTSSSGSSSGGSAPLSAAVIDSVDLSQVATAQGDTYTVYGSITFHDDTGKVDHVRVRVPVIAGDYPYALGDVATGYGVPLAITLRNVPPLSGAGDTTLELTLVDTAGGESAPPVYKTVNLQ